MATKKKSEDTPLLGHRPVLFVAESRLARALDRLETIDPEHQMTPEEADTEIGQWIIEAAKEKRDEFAEFILAARAQVASRIAIAKWYTDAAERMEDGIERMLESAKKTMQSMGATALAGDYHILKLKDSRGAVKIVDEAAIPAEFRAVSQDMDLNRIVQMGETIERQAREIYSLQGVGEDDMDAALASDVNVEHAREAVASAKAERTRISKTLIQAAWKENGSDRIGRVDPETGEIIETPLVPGAEKEVTTTLVVE